MSKARPEQSRPCRPISSANRGAIGFGPSKYRAKAWECAARAQSVSDPERRGDLLRFAGIWLSLTEPIEDDLRGAYEYPPNEAE
jgi:hypothetical protein